jgi:nucleoside-diphosphate-sugar epimerase
MKTAILTGATGFLGYWLLKELLEKNIFVYAVCRRNSNRLYKLSGLSNVKIIELDMDEISSLPEYIDNVDTFYHLAWGGERSDFSAQMKNVQFSIDAMNAADKIGVKHFIATGTQAEYGTCKDKIDENHVTNPYNAYGVCKLSTYLILKTLAKQLNLPFTWVRVFSVYGEDDGQNTLLISYLVKCFNENKIPELSTCENLWDFLYAKDAANALVLFGEKKCDGLYNLASGKSRKLRDFVIEARDLLNPNGKIDFNSDKANSGVELDVDISKIKNDLGWNPKTTFKEGILKFKK